MTKTAFTVMAAMGVALAPAWLRAEKPSPFSERDATVDEAPHETQRRDFIRGGHVNVGIIFGRGRDRGPGPGQYPDRHPDGPCYDCGYGRGDDDWRREEAKRRDEWTREEAKRSAEWRREADKRYFEDQREAEKRFQEQERETYKRRAEHEREMAKHERERFRERRP